MSSLIARNYDQTQDLVVEGFTYFSLICVCVWNNLCNICESCNSIYPTIDWTSITYTNWKKWILLNLFLKGLEWKVSGSWWLNLHLLFLFVEEIVSSTKLSPSHDFLRDFSTWWKLKSFMISCFINSIENILVVNLSS